ncbi:alpha/beta hydrolase [Streptomyces finlayi]|uniref:alpha/beta hydrolase n=1 Tax=Streptomyces finlayi TaxID=67296 RepID=UPI001624B99D|nr:alpha/beta fold hydrolase [Streptomyces finlayi]
MPLDRTGRSGATLTLQVLTAGRSDAPRGTLLFLTGGPGQPGVSIAPTIRKRLPKALAEYRLVMIDQRGTGAGAIDCPALQSEVGSSDTVPPTAAAVRDCARRLGGKRNFYTTADTVADLEDLRTALGIRSWGAVDGVSYGTFTAGRYALAHPRRVERLVLDSVVPLDGAGALYEASLKHAATVLRTACEEQSCGGDPAEDVAKVVRRDGNGTGVFNLLVVASIIDPKLTNPDLGILDAIHTSAGGDPGPLRKLVESFQASDGMPPEDFSSGLHAATLCADTAWPWGDASAPLAGRRAALDGAVRRIGPGDVWPFEPRTAAEQGIPQTCLPWPASRPGSSVPDRKLSMPVLLLSGERDLSTPPAWARRLAEGQPRARLTVIDGAGHSTQSRSDGGAKAAEEFLLR